MRYDEIVTLIGHVWSDGAHTERREFAAQMKDRQYGYDALLDAWQWFHAGWDQRERQENLPICPGCGDHVDSLDEETELCDDCHQEELWNRTAPGRDGHTYR